MGPAIRQGGQGGVDAPVLLPGPGHVVRGGQLVRGGVGRGSQLVRGGEDGGGCGGAGHVSRNQQDWDLDGGVAGRGTVLPEKAQYPQVMVETEPGGDGTVGPELKIGQAALDATLRPVGMHGPDQGLHLGPRRADQHRRRHGGRALLPAVEGVGQLDGPAIHAGDPPQGLGLAVGQLQDHIGSPRLTDHYRPQPYVRRLRPPGGQGLQHLRQVVAHSGEVIPVVWLVRAAVAPLVHGRHRVTHLGQSLRHPVPQPGVGSQTVDQQEGYGPDPDPRTVPQVDRQPHTARDRDSHGPH